MSENAKWLQERGWHTWYNEAYWVHPESVEDASAQDYTNYGMSLEDAIAYEKIGRPKHKSMGFPGFSRIKMAIDTEGLSKPVTKEY